MTDHAAAARAALGGASRAASLRIRGLHVAMASNEIAALSEELAALRLSLSAAEAELLRLADAADASATAKA